jgi:hypothetical protein
MRESPGPETVHKTQPESLSALLKSDRDNAELLAATRRLRPSHSRGGWTQCLQAEVDATGHCQWRPSVTTRVPASQWDSARRESGVKLIESY